MLQRATSACIANKGAFACALLGLMLSLLMHHATLIELDEIGSWGISKGGALEAIRTCILAQGQGPLYFILLAWWMNIFGDSVLALRSLSMVVFTASILCLAYGFCRLKVKEGVVTGALLVFLFSWCSLNYSFIARPYSLALFLVACGICTSAHPDLTRTRRIILALIAAATFFTHYFFVLPLLLASSLITAYRVDFDETDLDESDIVTRNIKSSGIASGLGENIRVNASINPETLKIRILSVISWQILGILLAASAIAPFFMGHLGAVSDLRYLTLPVPEMLIPALQSFPLAPIGLLPPLYLLLKKNWSIYDAYFLGLFELIFAIGLVLSLYTASHLLEGTFFVPRYFGIALPVLLILLIKVGHQLAAQKALLVSFVFSFQIFWSLFGPPNLADPLTKGLLKLSQFHSIPHEYRASLKTEQSLGNPKNFVFEQESKTSPITTQRNDALADNKLLDLDGAENLENIQPSTLHMAQYERNVKAPEELANCAIFISSGFIESVSLDRMHNELLQPFLRSTAEYFFRGDFELLPKHFFHYKVASEYINRIKEEVYRRGCALLVPPRDQGFSTQLWQSPESVPPSLRGTDLIIEPYHEWLDSLLVRAPL